MNAGAKNGSIDSAGRRGTLSVQRKEGRFPKQKHSLALKVSKKRNAVHAIHSNATLKTDD